MAQLRIRLRPWPVTALVAWTLFCWVNRIPLLWASSTQTASQKHWGTLPIAIFVVMALVALVAVVRSDEVLAGRSRAAALVLAVWSIGYWAIRLPWILSDHHPIGFDAVHTVLATVTVALSIWVLRTTGRRPAPTDHPRVPATA